MDRDSKQNQVIIYESENGQSRIEVHFEGETVWLTIDQMSELFSKSRSTINEHILNIYAEKELHEGGSMRKIGNSDFSTKPTNFYSLDVIREIAQIVARQAKLRTAIDSIVADIEGSG